MKKNIERGILECGVCDKSVATDSENNLIKGTIGVPALIPSFFSPYFRWVYTYICHDCLIKEINKKFEDLKKESCE